MADARKPPSPWIFGLDELVLVVVLLALLTAFHVHLSGREASETASAAAVKVALAPDASLVAAATPAGSAVYEIERDRLIGFLPGDGINLEFSGDGSRLLCASRRGTVRLMDARSGRTLQRWKISKPPLDLARLHPSGESAVAAGSGGVEVLGPGDTVSHLRGGLRKVTEMAFAEETGLLLLAQADESGGVFQVWDLGSRLLVKVLPMPGILHLAEARVAADQAVAISPDGSQVAMALCSPACLAIQDVATGALVTHPPEWPSDGVRNVRFSPTGRHVLFEFTWLERPFAKIWDLEASEVKDGPEYEKGPTDARLEFTWLDDPFAEVWSLDTREMRDGPRDERGPMDARFLDDGKTLATADLLGEAVLLWDMEAAEPKGEVEARIARALRTYRPGLWAMRIGLAAWLLLWILAFRRRLRHPERPTGRWDAGVALLPLTVGIAVTKCEFIGYFVHQSVPSDPFGLPDSMGSFPSVIFFSVILGMVLGVLARVLLGLSRPYRSRLIFGLPALGIAAWTMFATVPLSISVWSLFVSGVR